MNRPEVHGMSRKHVVIAALVFALAGTALGGSETPPEGPPWQRDLIEAHAEAVKAGKPIFLYFTKTY